jgi:glycosyltransferase involved in cell wall biosynthesis
MTPPPNSGAKEETVKVSVAMITYNHEPFIAQAVESALLQETSFLVEIVVGDDASTDRTREILAELRQRHPERIRLLLHQRNVGMHRNLVATLEACRGEYIALLEGDDYWTDFAKLQKQADFLDAAPDCAICHHNALRIYDDGSVPPEPWHRRAPRRRQTLDDLMRENVIVTCTAMFRRRDVPQWPEWYFRAKVGDWPLHILVARQGAIGYLDEVMGAYRVHPGGVWSLQSRADGLKKLIVTAKLIAPELDRRRRRLLERTVAGWHEELVECFLRDGAAEQARAYALEHLGALTSYRKLYHFYRGLEYETAGRRWRANRHLLTALVTGCCRTRIKVFDIALALFRTNCPATYQALRGAWRRREQ